MILVPFIYFDIFGPETCSAWGERYVILQILHKNRQVSWFLRRSIGTMRQIDILGIVVTASFDVSKGCTFISSGFIFLRGFSDIKMLSGFGQAAHCNVILWSALTQLTSNGMWHLVLKARCHYFHLLILENLCLFSLQNNYDRFQIQLHLVWLAAFVGWTLRISLQTALWSIWNFIFMFESPVATLWSDFRCFVSTVWWAERSGSNRANIGGYFSRSGAS